MKKREGKRDIGQASYKVFPSFQTTIKQTSTQSKRDREENKEQAIESFFMILGLVDFIVRR